MIRNIKFALLFGIFTGAVWAQAMTFDHGHSGWNEVVKKLVVWTNFASTVNYKELKSNSKVLDKYLEALSNVKSSDFAKWTRDEQLAFLINAYNAWTVKLILENYPVKSIKDIGGFFSSPWKKKFFKLFGNDSSLDWIEHEKIRPVYNEPRIHFALVCASVGCPGLRAEAFTAERLNEQLEDSTKRFLNDSSRNRFDSVKNKFFLSSIFKWYKDDFVKSKGSVQAFVIPYMKLPKNEPLSAVQKVSIEYLDYDWSLNEK